jgi:hypothetical protein
MVVDRWWLRMMVEDGGSGLWFRIMVDYCS